MPFNQETIDKLRATVDAACFDHRIGLPGATVVVVGKDGEELFAHAAGRRGVASLEDMSLDNAFWIASCTKAVTGIALMQLVEKGVLRLDDGEQIEGLCPELKTLKVLKKDRTLEEKKKAITLRMLLSHTAGFGYSFFNERLRDFNYPAGQDEFNGRVEEMVQPLLFQPGEGWEYGVRHVKFLLTKHSQADLDIARHRLGWYRPRARHGPDSRRLYEAKHLRAAGHQRHGFLAVQGAEGKDSVHAPSYS